MIDPNTALYYWGRLTREEAELKITLHGRKPGTYLLRSTWLKSGKDAYVVSVCKPDESFAHYQIERSSSGFFIPPGGHFVGPVEICKHHQEHQDGMLVRLLHPVDRPRGVSPLAFWGVNIQQLKKLVQEKVREKRVTVQEFNTKRSEILKEVLSELRYHQAWYHGAISREEAVTRLRGHPAGTFIVREAEKNEYRLTVLSLPKSHQTYERHQTSGPEHYQIQFIGNRYQIDSGPPFATLIEIIDYYHSRADRLASPLKYAAPFPATLDEDEPDVVESPESPVDKIESEPIGLTTSIIRIEPRSLTVLETIGQGQFGAVYSGFLNVGNGKITKVAIKSLKSVGEASIGEILKEAETVSRLEHEYIVRSYGICYNEHIQLVMEFAPLGPMHKYLRSHPTLPTIEKLTYMEQVCDGMRYLESNKMVHRDLAARNILLFSRSVCKITDFGMSRGLGLDSEYYRASCTGKWPLKWYPPESFFYWRFDAKSDVWSFGVTLWEVFSDGGKPYRGRRTYQVMESLKAGLRLECPVQCPSEVYSLMLDCWAWNKEDRPTFTDISVVLSMLLQTYTIPESDRSVPCGTATTTGTGPVSHVDSGNCSASN